MKGLRLGVVRHFYERENAANAATREAIDAVGKFATFERPLLTMPFNVTGSPAMSHGIPIGLKCSRRISCPWRPALAQGPKVRRLRAGGKGIRTIGPALTTGSRLLPKGDTGPISRMGSFNLNPALGGLR